MTGKTTNEVSGGYIFYTYFEKDAMDYQDRDMTLSRQPIPPKSEVRLVHATKKTPLWLNKIGTVYRVGYYGRKDGLDCIWLVDELGSYVETLDHSTLLKHFAIIYISQEKDLYGKNRGKLRFTTTEVLIKLQPGRELQL